MIDMEIADARRLLDLIAEYQQRKADEGAGHGRYPGEVVGRPLGEITDDFARVLDQVIILSAQS